MGLAAQEIKSDYQRSDDSIDEQKRGKSQRSETGWGL